MILNKILKRIRKLSISNQLVLYSALSTFLLSFLLYFVIPIIFNYPPGTINTQFDKEVSIVYYKYQFLIAILGVLLFFTIYLKLTLRKIDKWWKNKDKDPKVVNNIRKKALSFSYRVYLYIEVFPTLIVLLVMMLTGSHPAILLFKLGTIIFSFSTLIASLFLVFSKKILYPVLVETSENNSKYEKSKFFSLRTKLMFQLFPGVLVVALITSLVGYYRLTVEQAKLLNNYYKTSLHTELEDISYNPNIKYVEKVLSPYYLDDNVFCFIENPDGTIITSNGTTLSHFFVKYMHDLSQQYNNTVYETYTVDSQAVIQRITYNNQAYTIGIYFEISSFTSFLLFLGVSFILFMFNLILINYVIKSLANDINNVSHGLKDIINNKSADTNASHLPITSDDELGDLTLELNELQDLNKEQIAEIQDNQDKLMEKERLASLGQLIGGIAHNLKTPIMSISGAAEGINDLIKEYDSSIGDPEVTNQDHHDIAKDMSVWVEKIKQYTEYMSDVITAVKGQAVVMSEQDTYTFTIDELVKRVDILMKHELKNALIELVTKIETDGNIELKGNINSLVQVINNMISNAIQAYNGKTNKKIYLTISKEKNKIIIAIKDRAGGLPKEVSKKLFKEMITTKGKNGTGLGLFMSYSNIRAHFNGNITVDTKQGVGTEFKIILPL